MTLQATGRKIRYIGDGIVSEFPLPFPFDERVDIKALLQKDENAVGVIFTDFVVYHPKFLKDDPKANKDLYNSSYAKTKDPIKNGQIITFYRETPLNQLLNFVNGVQLNSAALNDSFDRIVMQVQELNEQVGRAFVFPITETTDPSEMLASIAKSEENSRLSAQEAASLAADVSVKTDAAIDAAERAESAANNAEVRGQSLYQDRIVLETAAIVLQEKVCRYERVVAANDDFTIDTSALNQQKDITFELILKMPAAVSFSLAQIVPFSVGETADNNTKWLGGAAPDLSEPGEHWVAFTSHDYGVSWRASYEGLFLL